MLTCASRTTAELMSKARHTNNVQRNVEDEVDSLFRLPLAAFTGARNELAARLKKSGRGDQAAFVKSLSKPSVSAWAVNQLYWNHRAAFDHLISSGERFYKAQTSRSSAKVADMRAALEARREALTQLTDIAASVLRDAAHNPSPDTIHRITTTLEGISAYASRSDGPQPGRLTHDVDPPGFESFASFVPGAKTESLAGGSNGGRKQPAGSRGTTTTNARRKVAADNDGQQLEQTRKAKLAAARVALQEAKSSLTEARARAKSLEAAQKKADAEAKHAEKQRSDAEERLEKAETAAKDAARRLRSIEAEVKEAMQEVKDAVREVEEAAKGVESLFRGSSGR